MCSKFHKINLRIKLKEKIYIKHSLRQGVSSVDAEETWRSEDLRSWPKIFGVRIYLLFFFGAFFRFSGNSTRKKEGRKVWIRWDFVNTVQLNYCALGIVRFIMLRWESIFKDLIVFFFCCSSADYWHVYVYIRSR